MSSPPAVTLRAVQEGDRARLLAWRNSPAVSAYMYSDHQITPSEHDRWFDGIASDDRRAFWVIEMDGEPVGLANLYDIDRANRRCAWAYYLAEPQVRGLGVGSFVEWTTIERVFGDFGLEKLWCEVLRTNEAVWKLHQSFGFVIEAQFRQHIYKAGQPLDVLGLGLVKADWDKVRDTRRERLRGKGYAV